MSDRGVIAAGKVANLIAVEGDPLEDPTAVPRVQCVMKGWIVVKIGTAER